MEEKIYEALKLVLNNSGSFNLTDTEKIIGNVNTNLNSGSDKKYEDILRTLKNTKGFGNDIDEIDEYSIRVGHGGRGLPRAVR